MPERRNKIKPTDARKHRNSKPLELDRIDLVDVTEMPRVGSEDVVRDEDSLDGVENVDAVDQGLREPSVVRKRDVVPVCTQRVSMLAFKCGGTGY